MPEDQEIGDLWAPAIKKRGPVLASISTRLPVDLVDELETWRSSRGVAAQTAYANAVRLLLAGPISGLTLRAAVRSAQAGELGDLTRDEALTIAQELVQALEPANGKPATKKPAKPTTPGVGPAKKAAAKTSTAAAGTKAPAAKKPAAKKTSASKAAPGMFGGSFAERLAERVADEDSE